MVLGFLFQFLVGKYPGDGRIDSSRRIEGIGYGSHADEQQHQSNSFHISFLSSKITTDVPTGTIRDMR